MDKALKIINKLESEGVIGKYAIGGAIGLLFYAQPVSTYDLDIFCYLPQQGYLISLGPLYKSLENLGYKPEGECISIEDVPVQFLIPPTELVKEALDNAVERDFNGEKTRVFQYEHLLAIMIETGRAKDKAKLESALESADPDGEKLKDILNRHNLLDRWDRMKS